MRGITALFMLDKNLIYAKPKVKEAVLVKSSDEVEAEAEEVLTEEKEVVTKPKKVRPIVKQVFDQ